MPLSSRHGPGFGLAHEALLQTVAICPGMATGPLLFCFTPRRTPFVKSAHGLARRATFPLHLSVTITSGGLMKHFTMLMIGLLAILVSASLVFAGEDDRTPTTRPNPVGVPQEGYEPVAIAAPTVPLELEEALKNALEAGNTLEAERLKAAMKQYLPVLPLRKVEDDIDQQVLLQPGIPNRPEWSLSDITVWSGNVKYGGLREIDLKKGEDGNLYLAVNRASLTGANGRADVYTSTNGGLTWTWVSGIQSATAYYGEISMTVELRHPTNMDSTRIILFYTRSASSAMASAVIRYASFLRDGSAFMGGISDIETPVAGRRFGSPSAFSDGAYYSSGTYLGLVVAEYTNDGDSTMSLRYYRSQDWGGTWSGATISASYQDWFPTAALKAGTSSTYDSVYIAVERRFSTTNYLVRVMAAPFNPPTSSHLTYYLPPSEPTAKYQRPVINIRQTGRAYGNNRDILITLAKNGGGRYHGRTGSSGVWSLDYDLASTVNVAYTFCASDSLTAGGGYFLAAYTDANGDTLGVRRGIIGSLGTRVYHNDHPTSTSVMPSCAIYKVGSTKYSAYAYAGLGPTNLYFNQESLTDVGDAAEVVNEYRLDQNFPNPFNPSTTIRYGLPQRSYVTMSVFNTLGQQLAILQNSLEEAGNHEVRFDAAGLSSGVYFYRLQVRPVDAGREVVMTKKLMLLR